MYTLRIWKPAGDVPPRIYLLGTTRDTIYVRDSVNGQLMWGSKAMGGSGARSGNVYKKRAADEAAVKEVLEAFGLRFRVDGEWARALDLATRRVRAGVEDDE